MIGGWLCRHGWHAWRCEVDEHFQPAGCPWPLRLTFYRCGRCGVVHDDALNPAHHRLP